jgi:phosphorylcholine metabolism protein LicD
MINKHDISEDKKVDLFIEATPIIQSIFPQFFLTMGSCLGIVREGRLLPWDDDIDCALLEKDFSTEKFTKLSERLINSGFEVSITQGQWVKLNARKYGEKLCLIVLYFDRDSNKFIRPSFQFPANFFQQFETINAYGLELRVPNPSTEYLEFIYGSDWRTPIKDRSERSLYSGGLYRRYTLFKKITSTFIRLFEFLKRK